MNARTICQKCYEKNKKIWTKTGWKNSCHGKVSWKCPITIESSIVSPYPPPWCEHRAQLESLRTKNSCPNQASVV